MNIYALSDLHLSFGGNKPMEVFGKSWNNYESRIKENWNNIVKDEDFVLICGDISWATYIDEAVPDFQFISELNGTKIISKGNHDYWWTSAKKQKEFLELNKFDKIWFLHNNSYELPNNIAVCGSRLWMPEDEKIFARELIRLELSLKSLPENAQTKIAMLHYPPTYEVMEMLARYGISQCVYGHLHASAHKNAIYGTENGVRYNLTSSDYLGFKPLKII